MTLRFVKPGGTRGQGSRQGWRHLCHPERSEGSACNARKQIPRYARDDNRQVSPAPMLLALNKPFHVLCQFTDRSVPPRRNLAEFGLPAGVYPAGRLDHDSEGLLLLTDAGDIAHRITDPPHTPRKTTPVQVEETPPAAP